MLKSVVDWDHSWILLEKSIGDYNSLWGFNLIPRACILKQYCRVQ
ncbi:hypothetical protein LptCag_1480 [Leptospirillum ferriphilum]|uniref:Uncharacterized protein n=1 Tax=Leptospirillum ferriphilum TaxID=178606 RepID=A0A094WB94_9BACT|nr:hypothetical protein LptCag_1480 [Leptospirillum ferriphilum]